MVMDRRGTPPPAGSNQRYRGDTQVILPGFGTLAGHQHKKEGRCTSLHGIVFFSGGGTLQDLVVVQHTKEAEEEKTISIVQDVRSLLVSSPVAIKRVLCAAYSGG